MGASVKNAFGDSLHQAAHELKNNEASGDDRYHDNEVARSKEDELKEVANERDNKGGCHNADNSK